MSWVLLTVLAAEWYVAPNGTGNGTSAATPFGTVQQGVNAAMPGDTVTVAAGTYAETVTTQRSGSAGMPITLRAAPGAAVTVTASGRVLTLQHAFVVVQGLILDGQYGMNDTVRIEDEGDDVTLRDCEVRRSTRDCIDMLSPARVTIERCKIHHCLNAAGGRTDAHGIVGSAVRDLVIRDTDVHTFSGDALQLDPARLLPGWDNVTVERCRFWLEPLPAPENGFDAGIRAGENGIDTKVNTMAPRARLFVRDTTAWGFRNGLIGNMAAFNLKENVDAVLERVTVYDSEIAFRTRGPAGGSGGARVTVHNGVVYDGLTGVRYEDDITALSLVHVTFGGALTRAFQRASSPATVADVRNSLVLGAALPAEAMGGSNRQVMATAFVNAAGHDYHLAMGAVAIDVGLSDAGVSVDRDGRARPQGAGFDVGAYEWTADAGSGGTAGGSGGTAGGSGGTAGGSGTAGSAQAGGSSGGGEDVPAGCGCTSAPHLFGLACLIALRRRRSTAARDAGATTARP